MHCARRLLDDSQRLCLYCFVVQGRRARVVELDSYQEML